MDKRDLVERLRDDAQGEDLGADGVGWSPDPALKREAADEIERLRTENAVLKREAHTWSKAAEHYATPRAPLTREQIDAVMTEHYPLSSLLREEVDAFERCVRDLERLHGIGA